MSPVLSCGVVVTDGCRLLIGHATRSPRWDIPKGQAEPGENPAQAACRELMEETGLCALPGELAELGHHAYLPRKTLALFLRLLEPMPDPAMLCCSSTFSIGGRAVPEFDRFACLAWAEALPKVGKSLRAVLEPIAQERRWT